MRLEGVGERVTIFVGTRDRHGHTPLYIELVGRARRRGLAGATVVRGVEGFGASSLLHGAHRFALSDDLPVAVVVVDEPARLDAFLEEIGPLIADGLVVRQAVEVLEYRAGLR